MDAAPTALDQNQAAPNDDPWLDKARARRECEIEAAKRDGTLAASRLGVGEEQDEVALRRPNGGLKGVEAGGGLLENLVPPGRATTSWTALPLREERPYKIRLGMVRKITHLTPVEDEAAVGDGTS